MGRIGWFERGLVAALAAAGMAGAVASVWPGPAIAHVAPRALPASHQRSAGSDCSSPPGAPRCRAVHVRDAVDVIGCMTSRVCVAGGATARGQGVVVPVINGRPGRPYRIRQTFGTFSISCPSRRGCIALGMSGGPILSTGVYLTLIDSSGHVRRTEFVPGTFNEELSQIACSSLTSCELAGINIPATPQAQRRHRPVWLEVGHWNGHRVRLHRMVQPGRNSDSAFDVQQISCRGASCDIVGYSQKLATGTDFGFVLHLRHGRFRGLHTIRHSQIFGVSCLTSSLCYATETTAGGQGYVVTLRDSAVKTRQAVGGKAVAIDCRRSSCVEAGAIDVPGGSYGMIATGRTYSNADVVAYASSFSEVALTSGGSFAAVGPANPSGGEIATG